MKNKLVYLIIFIIILVTLFFSFRYMEKGKNSSSDIDITKTVTINDLTIEALFYDGNMVDEEIGFGNVYTKYIKVTNDNDKLINYAINISEVSVSNDLLTYQVAISKERDRNYVEVIANSILTGDSNIAYNLTIEAQSVMYVKIDFKSNKEHDKTILKGELDIKNNLSNKEIFIVDINTIQDGVLSKINSLNGINEKGYYTYEVVGKLSGYVVVDASDISDLKYYYFVHNNELMINDVEYKGINKSNVQAFDGNTINNLNRDSACSNVTKKGCRDINTLTRNETGGRNNFYRDAMQVINLVKNSNKNNGNVIVYDVRNDINNPTNVRGYILVNNKASNPEYYIYLTNDLFMISGYNLTKNGEFTSDSSTIRAYNDTAFNLSSASKSTVCKFSGFNECFNVNNEKIS